MKYETKSDSGDWILSQQATLIQEKANWPLNGGVFCLRG